MGSGGGYERETGKWGVSRHQMGEVTHPCAFMSDCEDGERERDCGHDSQSVNCEANLKLCLLCSTVDFLNLYYCAASSH